MNWTRLLEVIEWAKQRSQPDRRYTSAKPDRGFGFTCNCRVCSELRRMAP